MSEALAKMELTASQGRIMGYLAHRSEPTCAKDIEEAFQLSHPTISGILSRLEKKGFIRSIPDEQDRRCKRIIMLPKGRACNERIEQAIRENECRLVKDFTPQERETFSQLLDRAITNMGGAPCKPFSKEDPN